MSGVRLRTRVAAIAGVASFLLFAGASGAAAYWTVVQQNASGSASSATLGLTLSGDLTAGYTAASTTSFPSGAIVTQPVALTSTSTTTLAPGFTIGAVKASGTLEATKVRVWITAKGAGACATPTTTTGSALLSASPSYTAPSGGASLAPGATETVCVTTRFEGSIATDAGKSLVISFSASDGVPSTSWIATTAAPLISTQTVSVTVPRVTCADNSGFFGYGLTLSFAAQAGVTYDVYKNTDPVNPVATNVSSGDLYTESSGNSVGPGVSSLRVVASVNGTAVSSAAIPIRYGTYLGFFSTIRCNPEGQY